MSWISKEHEKIYGKAFNALYKDVSDATASVLDKTGQLITHGYDKVNKIYQDLTIKQEVEKTTNKQEEILSETTEVPIVEEIENSEDEEENEEDIEHPLVIIKFDQNHHIAFLYFRKDDGCKTVIKSFVTNPYVKDIINTWFVYEKRSETDRYKWYPSQELYDFYQGRNKIIPIDPAIFRYSNGKYHPY